jgi:hypothetical protein
MAPTCRPISIYAPHNMDARKKVKIVKPIAEIMQIFFVLLWLSKYSG